MGAASVDGAAFVVVATGSIPAGSISTPTAAATAAAAAAATVATAATAASSSFASISAPAPAAVAPRVAMGTGMILKAALCAKRHVAKEVPVVYMVESLEQSGVDV